MIQARCCSLWPRSCRRAEDSSTYRTIMVEIEKFGGRKPYLGGFRNRKTQEIYHHASSQVGTHMRWSFTATLSLDLLVCSE
jgi:hypothetical protein